MVTKDNSLNEKTFKLADGTEVILRRSKPKDKILLGRRQLQINEGIPMRELNVEAGEISYMMAHLGIVTVAPAIDWEEYDDEEGLRSLYNDYVEWINSFRKPANAGA